ncbi:MAG: aldo/keto reductase [Sandaracinus sp.]|nr:aldo/keto reductase [Myxococcales bacterium]MCB9613827.1 aldo/keto reductase [Sandaracinus sp.]
MILQETYTLANGVTIPKLGLGTWMISNDDVVEAVRAAIAMGYRHVDTAQAYANEAGVGEGVRSAGVPRDQIFVTTKLAAEIKSYDEALRAIDGSLEQLGLDTIDLMLIHSPQPWMKFGDEDRFFEGNREAWRALEAAYEAGKLRAIGVSNFQQADLENLLSAAKIKPMVNQVLAHVGKMPTELIAFDAEQGILTEAYSPIGHGALLKHDVVGAMSKKYGASIAQLSIRYVLQLGLLPLPKTANPAHMKDNAGVDFTISDEDMATLSAVPQVVDYGEANMFPVYGGKLG